ncbi:MAG: adenylate/guanylate cyclase domain-containing protein [Acidimicrobiales bacterium]
MQSCTGCWEPLPEAARFCPACGRPADAASGPVTLDESIGIEFSKELRHITVVFCDLVGSTELSSTTDAEEYSELIQAYQHRSVAIARSFGGDVEGYSGDGILFRFGWPQAHDDDAMHAVAAALDIVEAVAGLNESRRLAIRIGVHSGQAVVGILGGADRRATMAVGETLNVAARLQGAAEPGTVVASAATIALVEGRFDAAPLGPLRLRGIAQPVEAFQVFGRTGARSRIEVAVNRRSPLIGRRRELEVLGRLWDRAKLGHGAAALITGEPGVGKSRLAFQVRDHVRGERHRWVETSCASYTRMSVLRPVVDLLEDTLSLRDVTEPEARLSRIRTGLEQAAVRFQDGDDLVAALLGISSPAVLSLSSEVRLERTIEVGVAWLIALGRQRPLVLLIEDLHWCDPTTLDALGRLLDRVTGAPVLVLMTARPEFDPPWDLPDVVTPLALEPLSDTEVRALTSTVGGRVLPDEVVERIVASAGGIPLYVEEVGRTVLESGQLVGGPDRWDLVSPLVDLEIPNTLQGSLLARLDALGPAKSVAQVAAVLGRTFTPDLLAEVSGMDPGLLARHLERVVHSGLLLHDRSPHGEEYVFKHVLIQEVAYESLLRRNRRAIHERVARVLDAKITDGVTVAPELVARHYEVAGLLGEAIAHYQLAATLAAERSGHREAIAFLRQGISLARQLPDTGEGREREVELQLALGSSIATRSYSDPELVVAYDRARELCELLGNDARVGQTLGGLSVFYINRGEVTLGADLARRVLTIADANDDDLLEVLGKVQLSLARSQQGRAEESLELAQQALAVYDTERHQVLGHRFGTDQGVAAHVFAGWSHLVLGHLDRGLAQLIEAVDLAEALGRPFNRVFAMAFLATGHWERGETAQTLHFAGQARRLAQEQGFSFWAGISGVWEAAERVITLGDRHALDDVIQAGLVAGESGNRGGSTAVLARVAEAAHAAGERQTTQGVLDMALSVSAETGQPWWDSSLLRQQAELHFDEVTSGTADHLTDPDHPWSRAAADWLSALELADRFGFPVHGVRAACGYAVLLGKVGRPEDGRRILRHWYGRCTEGLDTPVLAAVRDQLQRSGG